MKEFVKCELRRYHIATSVFTHLLGIKVKQEKRFFITSYMKLMTNNHLKI